MHDKLSGEFARTPARSSFACACFSRRKGQPKLCALKASPLSGSNQIALLIDKRAVRSFLFNYEMTELMEIDSIIQINTN